MPLALEGFGLLDRDRNPGRAACYSSSGKSAVPVEFDRVEKYAARAP